MRKQKIDFLMLPLLLLALMLMLAACGHRHHYDTWTIEKNATCVENGIRVGLCECGKEITEAIPATEHHVFSDWMTRIPPTVTSEGLMVRICSCGMEEHEIVPRKQAEKIMLTPDNFLNYFNILCDYTYYEYEGTKVFNYGMIDLTITCAQAVVGELSNVTVTLMMYPQGERWSVTEYTDEDRMVQMVIPVTTGVAVGTKEMGFATMQSLFADEVCKPERVEYVITAVTGSILISS